MSIRPYSAKTNFTVDNFADSSNSIDSNDMININSLKVIQPSLRKGPLSNYNIPAMTKIGMLKDATIPSETPSSTAEYKNILKNANLGQYRTLFTSPEKVVPKDTPDPKVKKVKLPIKFVKKEDVIETFFGSKIVAVHNDKLILRTLLYTLLFFILAHPKVLNYTARFIPNYDRLVIHMLVFLIIIISINYVI
jgi:hypothetical protein